MSDDQESASNGWMSEVDVDQASGLCRAFQCPNPVEGSCHWCNESLCDFHLSRHQMSRNACVDERLADLMRRSEQNGTPREEVARVGRSLKQLLNVIDVVGDPQSSSEERRTAFAAFSSELPPGVVERSAQSMRAKRGFDRMRPFLQAITALANEDEPLGSVASEQGAVTALRNLVNHCEELWSDAADLFMRGRYAPAQFLAIACVEETAKVLVARVQAANWKTRARAPKRPRDLENHRRKHWLAACGAAVINSRMDRIFGFDRVNWFIGLAEDEAVETIRQRSLYAEIVGNEQHLPYGHVVADDAKYLVAIAGELLAEATGLPEDFRRIIDAVSRFEDDCGIEASVPQLDDTGAVPPTPTPPTLEEPR